MRSYGNDPQAHIIYRYTGQEWDEETGLYNYHARLYDLNIGRFYQLDPKAQYFSPYKYAGNSPVSLVDPDGEIAFLPFLIIGGALIGGYLGGAAANDDWNPIDWDWKDANTYIGLGGGAIAGAFTPVAFSGSVVALGGGIAGKVGTTVLAGGGAYLMTSADNKNWNPAKWEWSRPKTWSAIFQGASTGPGIVCGVSSVHTFAKSFSATRKATAFLTVSYLSGGGVAYYGGVKVNEGKLGFWQWDWTNPATLSALVDGFGGSIGWTQGSVEIFRDVDKMVKNYKTLMQPKHFSPQATYQLGSLLTKMPTSKKQVFKAILKDPKHPLYKVVASGVMAYFKGSSANEDFAFWNWKDEFSTYEGVLNGIFLGKDTHDMLMSARDAKTKKRAASNSRKKRSLNYVKSHKDQLTNTNRSKSSNIKHLTESLLFNTIPPINQSNVSYKEGSEKPNLNIQDNYCDNVSSGSSRLQFWPINLVKRVGVSMLSFLPTSRILMPSLKSKNYVPQPESLVKQQPPVTATETSPTFLETGDQWLKNTDMTGNLMWGILLVRKWTGYRPATTTKVLAHDLEISTTELNIWATTLVSEFMDTLLSHAQACGIRTVASSVLEDFILHLKVIKSVHQKLSAGQLKAIPQLLCEQMVQQHINQIASASTQAQANKLLTRITKDIPKLQQQLLQQQQEWLSRKQCLLGMTTSSPLNNTKRADINTLKQAISSVPHQGSKQLLQQQRGLGGN
uniref:RHS repeat-associated core domain-containing protein n=1 Tax=Acrobeloides nanus TaxID=290746 RepID=A0A914DJS4_9BILA